MRQKIATFTKYEDAAKAKHTLLEQYPDKIFQVRNKQGSYHLVERTYPAQNEKISKKRTEKHRERLDVQPDRS